MAQTVVTEEEGGRQMDNTRTVIATGLSDERAAQVYNVLNFIPMLW